MGDPACGRPQESVRRIDGRSSPKVDAQKSRRLSQVASDGSSYPALEAFLDPSSQVSIPARPSEKVPRHIRSNERVDRQSAADR